MKTAVSYWTLGSHQKVQHDEEQKRGDEYDLNKNLNTEIT